MASTEQQAFFKLLVDQDIAADHTSHAVISLSKPFIVETSPLKRGNISFFLA